MLIVVVIGKHTVENKRVVSLQNLVSFILLSLWTHTFHHYDLVNIDALAAGTADVDEDPVALY
jgi:hypothetical protein